MNEGLLLATAIVAACLSALCAAADGALLAADGEVIQADPALAWAADRERLHRSFSAARVILLLAGGAAAALAMHLSERPRGEAAMLGALAAVAIVIPGEVLARAVGDAVGLPLLARLHMLARFTGAALTPFARLSARLDQSLLHYVPTPALEPGGREAAAEQFRQVVAAETDASETEEAIIAGVFSMAETSVGDVMVPRVDMIAVDADAPWSEVLDRVRSSEHARFPVYRETLDDVVGILYAKDLLRPAIADEEPAGGWQVLVRPALFIPSTNTLDQQLREFKLARTHIAIVVDEYGGTAGLVTIENVLEEIVGEIQDEYDVEEPEVEQEEGRRYWVSGRLTLDDLSEVTEHDFTHEQVSTVGGLIYERLGRVPRAGERLEIGGYKVVVERVSGRRIRRVYLERIERGEARDGGDA